MCEREGTEYAESTLELEFPGIGANLLTLTVEGFVFFVLTIFLERKFFIHEIKGLLKTHKAEEVESVFSPSEVSVVYIIKQSNMSLSKGF